MSKAAEPTAFIVSAENKYGNIAPINNPGKTIASIILILSGNLKNINN